MTPDLRRLCDAAKAEIYGTGLGLPSDRYSSVDLSRDVEAIVRAILMALKEPTYGMIRAADDAEKVGDDGRMIRGDFEREVAAMMDHILAEPATA